jgi:hypothetical protein
LFIEIRTITLYAVLPTRNKSIYSGSMEFCSPGTDEFFKGILSCCLLVEDFLQEVFKMLEQVVVGWREVW